MVKLKKPAANRGDSVELSRFFLPQFFSQNTVLNNAKKNGPRVHTDKKTEIKGNRTPFT